mgnify:CR=1 FL=1
MPLIFATSVNNHDILGIHRRINRFIVELNKSASSGVSQFHDHDKKRLRAYLTSMTAYKDWVSAQPHLDLPETHPQEYALEPPTEVGAVENESCADAMNLLAKCRDELDNSQSARLSSGLMEADRVRFEAIVEKIAKFLDEYVDKATPLDLPESSPRDPATGHGR